MNWISSATPILSPYIGLQNKVHIWIWRVHIKRFTYSSWIFYEISFSPPPQPFHPSPDFKINSIFEFRRFILVDKHTPVVYLMKFQLHPLPPLTHPSPSWKTNGRFGFRGFISIDFDTPHCHFVKFFHFPHPNPHKFSSKGWSKDGFKFYTKNYIRTHILNYFREIWSNFIQMWKKPIFAQIFAIMRSLYSPLSLSPVHGLENWRHIRI